MKQGAKILLGFLAVNASVSSLPLQAYEVNENQTSYVAVRTHPRTDKPYVSIIGTERPPRENPFAQFRKKSSRPDYRMLDPKVKDGEIPYDGPVSDRKKIFTLSTTLATLGIAGGAIGMAVAPAAAAGTGAASGGGAYLAGGTAVAAGSAGAAVIAKEPHRDDFTHTSSSELTHLETHTETNPERA